MSSSSIERYMADVFAYDHASSLLADSVGGCDCVHLQTDLSMRKGEERMSTWITFATMVKQSTSRRLSLSERSTPPEFEINRRIIWSGTLVSKEGKEQFESGCEGNSFESSCVSQAPVFFNRCREGRYGIWGGLPGLPRERSSTDVISNLSRDL